ncbi:hypothetical protein CBW18_08895 [Pedobacter sp. AJM]|jgi:hypothetical protein|nr:hypothetical protein CBW18_08895 [Pedobacter sp. AJM]
MRRKGIQLNQDTKAQNAHNKIVMKTGYIFFIMLLSINLLYIDVAISQTKKEGLNSLNHKNTSIEKSFYKIFTQSDNLCSRLLNDSVAIYTTNFRIEVIRKGSKTTVTKIEAADSLAYKLFPKYPGLKQINFIELFNKSDQKITIIMPIMVYGADKRRIKYRDIQGNPLTNMNAAINALKTSYFNFFSNEGVFNRLVIARPLICEYSYIE